jgi:hypothetical protein
VDGQVCGYVMIKIEDPTDSSSSVLIKFVKSGLLWQELRLFAAPASYEQREP